MVEPTFHYIILTFSSGFKYTLNMEEDILSLAIT
jgi:hypothetical protein